MPLLYADDYIIYAADAASLFSSSFRHFRFFAAFFDILMMPLLRRFLLIF